jgi:norsolorinic acid ketoreductase
VAEVKLEDMIAHMEPNAYGVVSLYQAVRPLLQKSKKEPIYSIMGTRAGSLKYVRTIETPSLYLLY